MGVSVEILQTLRVAWKRAKSERKVFEMTGELVPLGFERTGGKPMRKQWSSAVRRWMENSRVKWLDEAMLRHLEDMLRHLEDMLGYCKGWKTLLQLRYTQLEW